MVATETHQAIDAVWRIESAKLIAGITRVVQDVGLAEDLAQDALIAALEQWPAQGVPSNPGAWLMTIAKRRAIDRMRRNTLLERKQDELGRDFEDRAGAPAADFDAALDDDLGDDLLRLMFISCHPVLCTEARVALTLRLLGGLTTDEIARAFLMPEPTVAQRIVRAKRTLAEAKVPFELPPRSRARRRGWRRCSRSSTWCSTKATRRRRATTGCGRRFARTRCVWAACWPSWRPSEPEVHGLVALMEIQASRSRARIGPDGEPILLLEQDRGAGTSCSYGAASRLLRRPRRSAARRAVRAAGRDCRLPRARPHRRRDRLGPHRPALRGLDAAHAVAGGGAQPRRCACRWRSARQRARAHRHADRGASMKSYHLLPSVRGDFLHKLGAHGRSACRVRARGFIDAKLARKGPLAKSRRRLRKLS